MSLFFKVTLKVMQIRKKLYIKIKLFSIKKGFCFFNVEYKLNEICAFICDMCDWGAPRPLSSTLSKTKTSKKLKITWRCSRANSLQIGFWINEMPQKGTESPLTMNICHKRASCGIQWAVQSTAPTADIPIEQKYHLNVLTIKPVRYHPGIQVESFLLNRGMTLPCL